MPYRSKIWIKQWPNLVENVVSASSKKQIPLTVLDNLYVYGRVRHPISETTKPEPCSEKGLARLQGAQTLVNARESGQDIVLCRSSDFFGAAVEKTVLPWNSIEQIIRHGKKTFRWFSNAEALHSFSFTQDIAEALVEVCLNQDLRFSNILHMPVLKPFSANELSTFLSGLVNQHVRPNVLDKKILALAGVFNADAREQIEMLYQFESDYIVDDSLFRSCRPSFPKMSIEEVISKLCLPI